MRGYKVSKPKSTSLVLRFLQSELTANLIFNPSILSSQRMLSQRNWSLPEIGSTRKSEVESYGCLVAMPQNYMNGL